MRTSFSKQSGRNVQPFEKARARILKKEDLKEIVVMTQPKRPAHRYEDYIPPADVAHIRRKWLDIPYAHLSPSQNLDVYLPDNGDGPFPVIVYLHGGAFSIGDKRDIYVLNILKCIKHEYALVSTNYRLSGEATFPAGVQDVKAAIRWVRANGKEYQLDGNRIAVWGCSSGANFAAMACLTDNVSELDDLSLGNPEYPCNVQAAVDWFGPTDFLKMDAQLGENGFGPGDHGEVDSPESRYLGAKISDVPLRVELANPLTYIHEQMPPILIQHGRLDDLVPVQQSMIFADKLEKYVSPDRFEFDIVEGAGHADPLFETDENMERVFSFLDKHLK